MKATAEVEQGVYYLPADSPGFIVRVLIDLLDLTVIIAIVAGCMFLSIQWVSREYLAEPFFLSLIQVWIYMVPMKRSVGTLGYALFGFRIVDLKGKPPSLLRLTGRTFLPLIFNTLIDLVYLSSDPGRQALRDKISGTYMVKRNAEPAGQGPFVYSRTFFFNYNILYREVRRND